MTIIIDKAAMRVNDATVRQIIRCHKEGWQPVNIASICGVKAAVVQKILEDQKLL